MSAYSVDENLPDDEKESSFESDADKIVHRHLKDPKHVITEEEIKGIRIGMTPPDGEVVGLDEDNAAEKVADQKSLPEDESLPGGQKSTSWDVLEP